MFPMLYSQFLLSILYIVVCMHQSQYPNLSLLPYPLVIISLFSTSVILLLFCKQVHLCPFFLYSIYERYCDICLSVSDFLYSVSITRSSYVAANGISYFSWLNNIPLYICTTSPLSIPLLIDI